MRLNLRDIIHTPGAALPFAADAFSAAICLGG